jgi:hypothetical protein
MPFPLVGVPELLFLSFLVKNIAGIIAESAKHCVGQMSVRQKVFDQKT